MNILSTQYTLSRRSFEIYIAGCVGNPHCKNCHNPEYWDFNMGEKYDSDYFNKIKIKINDFDSMIDKIEIFGGESLDQDYNELKIFLSDLKTLNKPIWLFTRYELSNISNFIKERCDYIKCGRYIEELSCSDNVQYRITLATSNQKIYKKGINY